MTAWLVLMLVATSLVVIVYLFGGSALQQAYRSVPAGTFLVLSVIGAFNVACYAAMWKWKKWGLLGIFASAAITLVINLAIVGVSILNALLGLIGVAVLGTLVKPKWHLFE